MTNVVPLKRKDAYAIVKTVIDTSSPPRHGDTVAWQLRNKDGSYSPVMFHTWLASKGRDHAGHFVKRGSGKECASIGGLRYSAEELAAGHVRILGKVYAGHLIEAGVIPPRGAA